MFTATFSYHGPDPDIRSLRLHSRGGKVTKTDSYYLKVKEQDFSLQLIWAAGQPFLEEAANQTDTPLTLLPGASLANIYDAYSGKIVVGAKCLLAECIEGCF